MYGPYYPLHSDKYLKIRLIPQLLGDRTEMFRYYSCRFRVEKYKESCARLTINKQFHISNCFTLECSSFGYFRRETRTTHQFKEADLIEFGKNIAEVVLEQALIVERDEKIKAAINKKIQERRIKQGKKVTNVTTTTESESQTAA